MKKRSWIAAILTPIAVAAITITGITISQSAQAESSRNMLVTLYGWPDNSPPGDGTAFGSGHAGGVGTWANPVTFATDQNEFAPGTKVYYPYLHRYFIMQDECVACDNDWRAGKYHIDMWVGGQGGNTNSVIQCENSLTQSSGQVIIDPPSTEPVDTTPLFNSSTNKCYNPASFPGGGTPPTQPGGTPGTGHAITGLAGKCVDVAGASSANATAVQLFTCNGTGAQSWTHTGNTFQALGKCLDVAAASTANGAKVQIYDCNGTNAQNWTAGANGSLVNTGSGKCLDASNNSSADGTRLQIWTCGGGANQRWTI
jgi:hypothetical protein